MKKRDEILYPSILFKLNGGFYSISSEYTDSLLQLPQFETLPASKPFITGIFLYREKVIEMFDLRIAFGLPSLNQDYVDFAKMIDDRKQDHIHWVEELIRTTKNEEPFTLATNPHQCAFGKWYDSFKCENYSVNFHLKKIDDPHRKLHQAALEVLKCSKNCEKCTREECLQTTLEKVKNETMPIILDLLEGTKEIFRSNIYHEMVIVLNNSRLGVVVDEVLSVEELYMVDERKDSHEISFSPLISCIKSSKQMNDLIFELDVTQIVKVAKYS